MEAAVNSALSQGDPHSFMTFWGQYDLLNVVMSSVRVHGKWLHKAKPLSGEAATPGNVPVANAVEQLQPYPRCRWRTGSWRWRGPGPRRVPLSGVYNTCTMDNTCEMHKYRLFTRIEILQCKAVQRGSHEKYIHTHRASNAP